MSDVGLTLNIASVGAVATVEAVGELDVSEVADLRRAVLDAAEGADRVELDLRAVDFVDSMALSTLLELHHTLNANGKTLCVLADDGPVRSAIEQTGLRQLLVETA